MVIPFFAVHWRKVEIPINEFFKFIKIQLAFAERVEYTFIHIEP